jgi:hypothetical protein
MLIEQFVRALCALFIGCALCLGSSEPRTIGFGVLRRLLALAALLETFEIDHFPHHHPHETELEDATILKEIECCAKPQRAPASPVFISRKSLLKRPVIASKVCSALRKTQYYELYHSGP